MTKTFKNKSGKQAENYLLIKYHAHDAPMKRFINDGGGRTQEGALQIAERNLLNATVEWAVLMDANEKKPIHYYHQKKGIHNRIGLIEYKMCLTPTKMYSLWIVPTEAARAQGKTAERINEVLEEDIMLHDGKDVKKIEVYYAGKLVTTRQKGVYL